MTLLACIAILATFIEHKHVHILSEASVASLFGMVVGVTYIFGIYINESVESLPVIIYIKDYSNLIKHFSSLYCFQS